MKRNPVAQAIFDQSQYYKNNPGVWVSTKDPEDPMWAKEKHTLVYADSFVILTEFETGYGVYNRMNGKLLKGVSWVEDTFIALEDLETICDYGCSNISR